MVPRILGIIPARAGSKGIPDKNIVPLAGKPLICWTLDVATESNACDRIIVSTDSQKIADLAKENGAEVPFIRPPQYSSDTASTFSVVKHCLDWLDVHDQYIPDVILLLQPTSPFRSARDITAAVSLLDDQEQADAVVSVCEARPHPCISMKITSEGYLKSLFPSKSQYSRRQDMPEAYVLNGALYLVRLPVFLEQETFLPKKTRAYIMPGERSIDIDTPWDLFLSGLILENQSKTK